MKKLLALLLAAVMVIGLAACGSGTSTPAETTAAPAASSDASADNAADTTAAAALDPVTIKIWQEHARFWRKITTVFRK